MRFSRQTWRHTVAAFCLLPIAWHVQTLRASEQEPGLTGAPDLIRIATPYRIDQLDPIKSIWSGPIETFGQLYSRLLRRDNENRIQPGLADRWEVSQDGLEYTFHLRAARFSDGSQITAHDVIFSLLRMRDHPEAAYPAPVSPIKEAFALDNTTLKIKLKEPNAPFLEGLEMCFLGIVSKTDIERRGEVEAFAGDPVTSGPYKVASWKPNEHIILEPNPHYWRTGFPKNEGVIFQEVVDPNTRIAMLLAGEADVLRSLPATQVARIEEADSVHVPFEPATRINIVLLNHERPPFSDIRVRQAAWMALDRTLITKVITRDTAHVAQTLIPDTVQFHHDQWTGWPHDPERARMLVEEAGMIGHEVVLMFTAPSPENELIALILQSKWATIGLKVIIEKTDSGMEQLRLTGGDYDANPNWWYNENSDPDLAVKWALCSTCGNFAYYSYYHNEEVNRLVSEGARMIDREQRRAIYHRIQEITAKEAVHIPLYYQPWLNGYRKEIKGLRFSPSLQWSLESAYRDKSTVQQGDSLP